MTLISVRAEQFKKFVYRSITYPLVMLALFAAILSWRMVVMMGDAHAVDHSDKVMAEANSVLNLAVDEETGARGYLVNGNRVFLDRYQDALMQIGGAFNDLEQMVQDNPQQEDGVKDIRVQYVLWQHEMDYELNLSTAYPVSYRNYFDQGREKVLMDTMRSEFAALIANESHLRETRESGVENETLLTLISSAVLALFFGLGLAFAWVRQAQEFAVTYDEALNVSQRNLSLLNTTLMSIGDAVLVTDSRRKIIQMNVVAEQLTSWKFSDAHGMDADIVFKIVDKVTHLKAVSPIERVLSTGAPAGLIDQAILIRQDGSEIAVDDSCSPIVNERGKLVGAILVFRDVTERKRAEQELARLYEREHRIAENLQRSLLSKPDPSLFPALDVETLYQPAWAEAKVGGDYYDIICLEDGKAAMIVGDVSGKGLKAASRTAEMKFTLRAYLRENASVADAVSRLNNFVCQSQSLNDDSGTFFLCLTVVVVDTVTGGADVCVAGSEPPLLVRRAGTTEEVVVAGTPVGVFEESEYSAVRIQLGRGDMIVIATDGITEARKEHNFLGNEGLANLALKHRALKSLADVGAAIVDGVKLFADNKLSDDICLLLLRRK